MGVFVPWYQDRDVKSIRAVELVRCLKRLKASKQERIVEIGVDQLNEISDLQDYDLIIAIPSSYALVSQIMVSIKRFAGDRLVEGLLYKLPTSKMMVDWEKAEREGSSRTVARLKSMYNKAKAGLFEIKNHGGSYRRYLFNFMAVNMNHAAFERLKTARKILFVDDTYGIGASITEALRVIRQINPTVEAQGFCMVHDFPSRTKMIKNFSHYIEFDAA